MLTQYNTLLKLIVAILLCSIFGGCTSIGPTKPNESYPGPYPLGFNEFAEKSPLLAQELFKLPELQDGISEKEATGLENIMKLYDTNPDMFDSAFEHMYKVGIPEVRRYCSPLQAIYWLALDGKEKELAEIISNYKLEFLIQKAWVFDEIYTLKLSKSQITQILNSMNGKERDLYEGLNHEETCSVLKFQYTTDHDSLPWNAKRILQKALEPNINFYRWKDFNEVTDRLNTPYLITIYSKLNLTYVSARISHEGPKSASKLFEDKEGECSGFAAFDLHCLKKAGYSVRAIRVKSSTRPVLSRLTGVEYGHVVCEFEEDGEKYIMDNSCRRCTKFKRIMKSKDYLERYPQTGVGLYTSW